MFDVELSCGVVSGSNLNHVAEMLALLPASCPGVTDRDNTGTLTPLPASCPASLIETVPVVET